MPDPATPTFKARAFIDAPLVAGAPLDAPPGLAHHLATVLRAKAGDAVAVFNGRDGLWRATITAAGKKHLTLRIEDQICPQRAEPDIWMLFAPLKKTATDYLVEKATELGVARLVPVLTDHTETRRLNTDRLTATVLDAAAQCERLSVPTIEAPRPLKDVLAHWNEGGDQRRHILAAMERKDAPLLADAARTVPGPHAILIGPEGGFSGAELDALGKHADVTGVRLGPRILRAETAAVTALALWQGACGDFSETD